MAHTQHIHVPVIADCWDGAAMGLFRRAANAGADGLLELVRASADQVVEIDLHYWFLETNRNGVHLSVDAATSEALADMLPLCKSMDLPYLSGVFVEVFCAHLANLTALKELTVRVDADSWIEETSTDRHGQIHGLGSLCALQSLTFELAVSGATGACAHFCGQMTQLQ